MPRYFFHFSDGKRTFTDSTGTELAGLADARKHVFAQVRDMKGSLSDRQIQEWSGWKMIVVDANGKAVFETGFDLIPKLSK